MIISVDENTFFSSRIQGSQLYYLEHDYGFTVYMPKGDGVILKTDVHIPVVIDEETGVPNFEQKLFFASAKLQAAMRVLSVKEEGVITVRVEP